MPPIEDCGVHNCGFLSSGTPTDTLPEGSTLLYSLEICGCPPLSCTRDNQPLMKVGKVENALLAVSRFRESFDHRASKRDRPKKAKALRVLHAHHATQFFVIRQHLESKA